MSFIDKIKDLVSKNASKAAPAIDKVADVADDKTKGKYTDKIDQAADKAKELADKLDDEPKK